MAMTRQVNPAPSPTVDKSVSKPTLKGSTVALPATGLLISALGVVVAIATARYIVPTEAVRATASAGPAMLAVIVVWSAAFAVVAAVYVAISAADAPVLLAAAARAGTPAMWYVPALLFLSAGTAISIPVGLALTANATRQLFSIAVPDRYAPATPARRRAARIFQNLVEQPPRHLLPLLGACSLELGVIAVAEGNLLLAALACVIGAAMWTRSAVSRGAVRTRQAPKRQDTLLAVVLTIICAVALASMQIAAQKPSQASFYDTAREIAIRLVRAYDPPRKPQARSAAAGPYQIGKTPGETPAAGLPGILLVPPPPRSLRVQTRRFGAGPKLGGGFAAFSEPIQIPFTGEYQLFAASVGRITPGSPIFRGSPLDMEYATVTGAMVDTVAYQPLDRMLDFRQCGTVQAVVVTRDSFGSATLQLVTGGRLAEVGLKIFGISGKREELLDYEIPRLAGSEPVTALRLVFHRDTRSASHSVRVAVRGFTLIPRGSPAN